MIKLDEKERSLLAFYVMNHQYYHQLNLKENYDLDMLEIIYSNFFAFPPGTPEEIQKKVIISYHDSINMMKADEEMI